MALLKLESPEGEYSLTSDNVLRFDDPLLLSFIHSLELFRNAVPLEKITLDKQPNDTYKYKVTLTDGRVWKQTISFPDGIGSEAASTFDISLSWRDSEFLAHRDVRRYLVLLIQQKLLSDCAYEVAN